jgi:hypothetical protein
MEVRREASASEQFIHSYMASAANKCLDALFGTVLALFRLGRSFRASAAMNAAMNAATAPLPGIGGKKRY